MKAPLLCPPIAKVVCFADRVRCCLRHGVTRMLAAACLWLGLLAMAPGAANAQALSCSFSVSDMAFGTVDLTSGQAADSTATLSVSCSGAASRVARVCPNLGSGGGGDTGNGSPRKLLNGANALLFTFYTDASRTIVWGSFVWPWTAQFPAPTLDMALGSTGRAAQTYTIFGRVLPSQSTAPSGAYTSSFAGGHTLFSYGYSTVGNCPAISATGGVQQGFTVSANVARTCNLTTTPLDFGRTGSLGANVDGSGQLRLICSPGVAYSVGLDGGAAGATLPNARKLVKGTSSITYGLYADAARTQAWFNANPYYQAGGTGNGAQQTLTVYGRIPPQTTPPPGVYIDNVVVNVTY